MRGEVVYSSLARANRIPSENLMLYQCYFRDKEAPALLVTPRESKQLIGAHFRFSHGIFKPNKALEMRMPAKIPLCRACMEAKSIRHPMSAVPPPPTSKKS